MHTRPPAPPLPAPQPAVPHDRHATARALPRRQALAALLVLAGCSRSEPPAPPASPAGASSPPDAARAAYEQTVASGTGFAVGQALAARSLRVLFDPQCPHCATLWLAAKPLRDRLSMVWMPVAFINPNSAPQGAMILSAVDPVAQMDEHETLMAQGKGGLAVAGDADATRLSQIKANTDLLQKLGAESVPHLLWRAGPEGPYGTQSGGLSSEDLARLLGL